MNPDYTVTIRLYGSRPDPSRTIAMGGADVGEDLQDVLADVYDPAARREVHKAVIALQCALVEALRGRPVSEWIKPEVRDPAGYQAVVNS